MAEDAKSVIKLEFPCLGLHLYIDTVDSPPVQSNHKTQVI
jgi:hypothetical protein